MVAVECAKPARRCAGDSVAGWTVVSGGDCCVRPRGARGEQLEWESGSVSRGFLVRGLEEAPSRAAWARRGPLERSLS